MKTLAISVGILALTTTSLFASTTYGFLDPRASNQNSETYNGQSEDMGPYGGSIGSSIAGGVGNQAAKLFCDDFADGVNYNSGWAANITSVNAADLSNTRYGSANLNPNYPTGTKLYEQLAWLYTQIVQPGQSIANQDALGEAAWYMTGGSGTPKATATNTGSDKTYLQWITQAQSDYNQTVSGYATPNYGNWMVVTDVAAKGNTGGTGKQEFLAYYNSASPQLNGAVGTPEPSTSVLLGTGLIAAGLARRRKLRK